MRKQSLVLSALLIFGFAGEVAFAKKATSKRNPTSVDRPEQFVLLAFDGSKDINFWDESVAAAESIPTNGPRQKARFTYFINPTYYLAAKNKQQYNTPRIGPGKSCIGWSESADDIAPRISRTNKAFIAGHEIGSHANSHCDQSGTDRNDPMFGKAWTEDDWSSEFDQFNNLLFNAFKINGVTPLEQGQNGSGFAFSQKDIVGFRAPKLAYNAGLWPTLKKFNFRYDTSKSSPPDYWPQRESWGGWNFPLAQIKIAGTNRKTLSMDYNWLVYHSAGASKPGLTDAEYQQMYTQMLDSYKFYFKKNYYGNRAPIHIGHHFSKWNRGVYWNVMKDFAKFVCSKPEVYCVTYAEYANWLDNLAPSRYEAYRKGEFERLRDDNTIKDIATPVLASVRLDTGSDRFEAMVSDEDRNRVATLGWKLKLEVNNTPEATTVVTRAQLQEKYKKGSSIIVRAVLQNRSGTAINWETYRINQFGEAQETLQGPLENNLLDGESADAHQGHE